MYAEENWALFRGQTLASHCSILGQYSIYVHKQSACPFTAWKQPLILSRASCRMEWLKMVMELLCSHAQRKCAFVVCVCVGGGGGEFNLVRVWSDTEHNKSPAHHITETWREAKKSSKRWRHEGDHPTSRSECRHWWCWTGETSHILCLEIKSNSDSNNTCGK